MTIVLYLVLAAALAAYAFWIYTRVELAVPAARKLAVVRTCAFALLLLLLFDPRVPSPAEARSASRWVLLDESLSMAATDAEGRSAWEAAAVRARELEAAGWRVVRFAGPELAMEGGVPEEPAGAESRLAPALQAAAEGGASQVRVLSDFRLEDGVALRAVLEALSVDVSFEVFGGDVRNAGIGRFEVPDLLQPEGSPTAEIELHGGTPGDSLTVEILEEERVVASARVPAPSPGLRAATTIELPTPAESGRVRYAARVALDGDAFAADDQAVSYANVGYQEGALVLVSTVPDWEPRYLLPVLEEVTGLSGVGFLRAGPDRWVRLGRAIDRGRPADSATVRRAAADAAVLVVHGLGSETEEWLTTLVERPGRRLLLPADEEGAGVAGLDVSAPRAGEWYASPDVPTSPIAGALVGVSLQGLPPLTGVMVPQPPVRQPSLHVQLRGAGAPESAFALLERPSGRSAVALTSGFWRWAARDAGREPYRRLWSGVAGWLLADQRSAAAEPRPEQSVVRRGEPVRWSMPDEAEASRIVVSRPEGEVMDTTVVGERPSIGVLPPGAYAYTVSSPDGDTIGSGRFDVSAATSEMLPSSEVPELPLQAASAAGAAASAGIPLRTQPWPYLLLIVLLCAEWVVRRRSGLR
jgi:hypothetical protein